MRPALLAALLVAAAPGDVVTGPAGSLPPRPAVVEAAPDAPVGELSVEPPLVWVDAPPGTSAQPELAVVSGADPAVDLAVEVVPVAPGNAGAPQPVDGPDRAAPSAVPWIGHADRSLHLAPAELARLWPTVTVPAGADTTARIAAVRFTAPDRAEVAALVAVDPGGPPADLDATVRFGRAGDDAVATLVLRADEVTSVTGTLEVRGWFGATLATVALPETVVLPGAPRTQEVAVRAPAVPGPYGVRAVLRARGAEPGTASASAFLWNPVSVAIVVVVVAASVLYLARRRWWT